ncbi:hypothetical protein GCM10023193_46280 [Planotetraspora kaengkrachanensis]|uniref:Uncharacterized protein n=1 Tax=Planotetraspora kaengkrachanensis TaxID=575193 RepID=A0A8J3M1C2_9ACTN|nr:hypothetical protein Pka01_36970 [Planotetraspora kaengkrachanensis]
MSSLDPALKDALRRLRAVRSTRPEDPSAVMELAEWRDAMAAVLEELARVLPIEEDRIRASHEANCARTQAAQIRAKAAMDNN